MRPSRHVVALTGASMLDDPCGVGTFAEDVAVVPLGGGRFRAALDNSWDLVGAPQGGVLAAFGLRAAAAALGAEEGSLRSCTAVFAGRVTAGELSIGVDVLRRGRTASQVVVDVRNDGADAGTILLAVFGTTRSGPSFVDAAPPNVPPPDACRSMREPPPAPVESFEIWPFWTRVEGRAALGHAPWEQYEPTSSDFAAWYRFDDPPRARDGSLDPLAVLTLADRMPGCIGERLGPQTQRWFAPSADLTVHLFAPLRTEWLLAHDRARWAHDGWASAESNLWDQDGQLVGYATQTMIFTGL